MKTIKRIAAILLVCVMALTVVGCHRKDEIAVTIGDVEFTSAYYMCALINAEMEAQNLVYEKLTDEEIKAEDVKTKIYDNFVIADILNASYSENADDNSKAALKARMENYASEYYDTVKGMKIGEAVVKETSAGDGLYILFKQDIKADDYYLDTLDKDARHLIADKEYEKFIEDYAKKLEADVNNFAVKQFKVKKIVKPEQ